MKKPPAKCADCDHSQTQHMGGEGCWAQGEKPWLLCGCMAYQTAKTPVEEVDRYGVLDKDGLDEKADGQDRALRAVPLTWKERFVAQAGIMARSGRPFTSEDVIAVVGLPSGDVETNANNAVGAMMSALAKSGLIEKTGQRVLSVRSSSHGAELTEWVGCQ